MSIKNVSFIGLGVMGYPMAGHLSKVGHQVFVYNRTIEKAKKWTKEFINTSTLFTKKKHCFFNDLDEIDLQLNHICITSLQTRDKS